MILQKSIKVNNLEEIQEKINEVNVIGFECPKCKSHEFNYYGSYKRFLIVLIDEEPVELSVRIKRIRCKGCGKTHAVIPDFIIPYKIYGFKIVNKIMYFKINNIKTNKEIEEEYGVSRQVVRKWEKEIERIKTKIITMINDIKNILEIEMQKYYKEYSEIYMMRREGFYNYTST